MNPLNRPKNLKNAVQEFCIVFLVFLFIIFALAIFGVFYKWLLILIFALFLGIIVLKVYYLYSFRKIRISRFTKGVLIFIVLVSFLNGFLHHGIPHSRDNVGYLTAGIMLAQSDKLHFKDIISRPFHPFREFGMGEDIYTSQFLPGYNAYLGFWYDLGGLFLLFWGNALLYFLFLICFYGVARDITSRKTALFALLFLVTFYAFLWFPRRTNSENLLMFLIWAGTWLFIRGIKTGSLKRSFWAFLPISLAPLVRGEGLIYLVVFGVAAIVLVIKERKKIKRDKMFLLPLIWVPASIFLLWHYSKVYQGSYVFEHGLSLFYTITDFLRVPFMAVILVLGLGIFYAIYLLLKKFALRLTQTTYHKIQFVIACILVLFIFLDLGVIYYHHHYKELVNWQIYRTQYVLIVLGKYFLFVYLIFFVLGLLGKRLLPSGIFYTVFLLSPSLIFFLDPFVGLDQPWFLRRFYPTIIPFLFILGTFGLFNLHLKKKHLWFFIALLLLINLWVSYPIIFFSEYKGMGEELSRFADHFEKDSLILMDPGWHWQQWAYTLHYVYGYNVLPKLDNFSDQDLAELLDSYDPVYIVSEQEKNIFDDPAISDQDLEYLFDFMFHYPTIVRTSKITKHIVENEDQVQMKKVLLEYRGILPRQRDVEVCNLYVYEYKK